MAVFCEDSNKYFKTEENMNKYRRMRAHNEFDIIRKRKIKHRRELDVCKRTARNQTYRNLAEYLGKTVEETHMKQMDKKDCMKVIEYARQRKKVHMFKKK